jgi:hypothetical protein
VNRSSAYATALCALQGKEKEVYDATLTVLKAAAAGDWKTYAKVCDESITCFEPEAMGCVATGLDFHKFYFTLPSSGEPSTPPNTTLVDVNIRMLGSKGEPAPLRCRFQPGARPRRSRRWPRPSGLLRALTRRSHAAASICYTRLVQRMGAAGPETVPPQPLRTLLPPPSSPPRTLRRAAEHARAHGQVKSNESRVFLDGKGGGWKCVHFHRSPAA